MAKKYNIEDLVGKVFTYLTILEEAPTRKYKNSIQRRIICKCKCGKIHETNLPAMINGSTKSCGCYNREKVGIRSTKRQTTHNKSRTDTYHLWVTMRNRCNNEKYHHYSDYGGRGIKVCERWNTSYENFINDMGERDGKGLSIERIDTNGNYEPSNCRWATAKEQANNRRNTIYIKVGDKKETLSYWCEKYGLSKSMIYGRIKRGEQKDEKLLRPKGCTR